MILNQSDYKSKPASTGTQSLLVERKPIEPNAYYSIRELSDKTSPYYVVSASTIFRALRAGTLKANYIGRAVRIRGAAIHAMFDGEEGR